MAQGVYYMVSGAWPLLHMDSFQKVTGRKTDLWLVNTVGLLLVAIGAGLVVAGVGRQTVPALVVVAMASAAALVLIELVYVRKRVVSPIYLADAVVELGFIGWWVASLA